VVGPREQPRVVAPRRAVVTGDEEDDPVGGAPAPRLGCPKPRVVEIAGERGVSAGKLAPDARREAVEQHTCDPVPQARLRGLRDVVEQTCGHELLVGAEPAEDRRGALGMPQVGGAPGGDHPQGLPSAGDHQNSRVPTSRFASAWAGPNTTWNRIRPPKKSRARSSIGPYCA